MALKHEMNTSEIIQVLSEDEGILVSREAPHIDKMLLTGDIPRTSRCPLYRDRQQMEEFLQKNIRRLRTQLSCTGRCTTYGCPVGVVIDCTIKFSLYKEK